MNTHPNNHLFTNEEEAASLQEETHQNTTREPYHAPQIKIHGKLERLTLQGTGGSGIVDPNDTPIPEG